jgi:hypothetical protein
VAANKVLEALLLDSEGAASFDGEDAAAGMSAETRSGAATEDGWLSLFAAAAADVAVDVFGCVTGAAVCAGACVGVGGAPCAVCGSAGAA